jgi:hypothetical protein
VGTASERSRWPDAAERRAVGVDTSTERFRLNDLPHSF